MFKVSRVFAIVLVSALCSSYGISVGVSITVMMPFINLKDLT